MIDFGRVEGFEWDDGNARKSADKHGVGQAEAEQAFLNEPLVVAEDAPHSRAEARFHALGRSDAGRLLHVTFTLRRNGTLIRVVSARDMSRKERMRYEQEQD
ncbi:MAG: BrnT family toxin [Alphaproteobacteria bacterium]|nr:BrnT family toxin [Alphaproteobacteria bacterium]